MTLDWQHDYNFPGNEGECTRVAEGMTKMYAIVKHGKTAWSLHVGTVGVVGVREYGAQDSLKAAQKVANNIEAREE